MFNNCPKLNFDPSFDEDGAALRGRAFGLHSNPLNGKLTALKVSGREFFCVVHSNER